MPLLTAAGFFTIPAGSAANIEINITDGVNGDPFQPKAVIFYGVNRTAAGVGAGNSVGMGWATGTTQRGCVLMSNEDNVGTTDCDSQARNDACYALALSDGSAEDGRLDLVSFDVDGFTVVPDNTFAADTIVNYLALGGDSLTNAFAGSRTLPGATGNFATTGVGFAGNVLLMAAPAADLTTFNTYSTHGGLSFGFLAAGVGGSVGGYGRAATANSESYSFIRRDDIVSIMGNNLMTGGLTLVSFDADGFTLNRATGTSQVPVIYLVLAGVDVAAVNLTNQTGTGPFTAASGLSFTPSAFIAAMQYIDNLTDTTPDSGASWSVGMAVSALERGGISIRDVDAADPTQADQIFATNRVLASIESGAMSSDIDVESFDAAGITLNQTAAGATGHPGWMLILGPSDTEGGSVDGTFAQNLPATTVAFTGTVGTLAPVTRPWERSIGAQQAIQRAHWW